MSWFNLYRKFSFSGDFYDDERLINEAEQFLNDSVKNKGKNIKVYDEITLEELDPLEVNALDEIRNENINSFFVPLIENDKVSYKRMVFKNSKRKYKSRLPISIETRKLIHKMYDSKCSDCNKPANQIHHRNKDPSDNNIDNLELLCYDCHLKTEGKKKFKVRA
jgi:hypothetical protein